MYRVLHFAERDMYIYIQADICILRIHIVCFFRSYINLAALEIVKDQIGFLHVNIYIYTHIASDESIFDHFRCVVAALLLLLLFDSFDFLCFVFCFLNHHPHHTQTIVIHIRTVQLIQPASQPSSHTDSIQVQ